MTDATKEGVLKGVRAIEWATFGNGPILGVILGDLGAEVIKLEDRVAGESIPGHRSVPRRENDESRGDKPCL